MSGKFQGLFHRQVRLGLQHCFVFDLLRFRHGLILHGNLVQPGEVIHVTVDLVINLRDGGIHVIINAVLHTYLILSMRDFLRLFRRDGQADPLGISNGFLWIVHGRLCHQKPEHGTLRFFLHFRQMGSIINLRQLICPGYHVTALHEHAAIIFPLHFPDLSQIQQIEGGLWDGVYIFIQLILDDKPPQGFIVADIRCDHDSIQSIGQVDQILYGDSVLILDIFHPVAEYAFQKQDILIRHGCQPAGKKV